MSAILRVKDKDGKWIDIPAIKGIAGVGIQKTETRRIIAYERKCQ